MWDSFLFHTKISLHLIVSILYAFIKIIRKQRQHYQMSKTDTTHGFIQMER